MVRFRPWAPLAFGVYPDVGLADAREKRDAARKLIAAGKDPAALRKQEEQEAQVRESETFRAISCEWVERLEKQGRSESTLKKMRWLLEFADPSLGDQPAPISVPSESTR